MSVFCRHNRFTADCPICSKGTVLEGAGTASTRSPRPSGPRKPRAEKASPTFSGPHVSVGPYEDEDSASYQVRLERVPGGVRLAEWSGSRLRKRAPVMEVAGLAELLGGAAGVLADRDAAALVGALEAQSQNAPGVSGDAAGVSRGRSGDFKEELRIEPLKGGMVRVARWVLRPGSGWQLQDAPPMLPAGRYAQAVADARGKGLLAVSEAGGAARP